MNLFQILALTFLALLALATLRAARAGAVRRSGAAVRLAVVITAGVAIADPSLVQSVADLIGIRRGADVVLYAFALAFLASTFYFYARTVKLERRITGLVQHVALMEARRGSSANDAEA